MNRIGVIYIGENSVRLTLSEVYSSGYFKIIDELNSSVRICYDLIENPVISEDKINETISTLRTFKSLCLVSGVNKIISISSEALRLAQNSKEIKKRIKDELDLDIIVLSTSSEIYYNFLALKNSIYFDNAIVVNISGSTTHISWIKDNEVKEFTSLPIGAINLSDYFGLSDVVATESLKMTENCIDTYLEKLSWIKDCGADCVIGVGGTIRALGRMDRARKKYPLDLTHNYIIDSNDVHHVFNLVKSKDLRLRREIEGLSTDRADIIVGGISIIDRIIDVVSADQLIISGRGVREGVMYEYIANNFDRPEDILDYNLNGIADSLNLNKRHAKNVYKLFSKLFIAFKPLHRLGSEYSHIIKTAAILHDCGTSIDYYNHHKHSFYIILNSYINGLTHKELLISAAVAASHRNNSYHLPLAKYSSILNSIDMHYIDCLGVLLKISEGLDRSLEGAVKDLSVEIDKETVTITVQSDLNIEMEIHQALRCKDKFKDVYSRDLVILKK